MPHGPGVHVQVPASVLRSSQYGKTTSVWVVHGRQVLPNWLIGPTNWAVPSESTLIPVYV